MRPVNESEPVEIAALAGSLRAGSLARAVLRAADQECPTGVRIFIIRFVDGRIAETWVVVDVLSQLRQLGVDPI
jgi:NAD(P)H-dependent FMN reductase